MLCFCGRRRRQKARAVAHSALPAPWAPTLIGPGSPGYWRRRPYLPAGSLTPRTCCVGQAGLVRPFSALAASGLSEPCITAPGLSGRCRTFPLSPLLVSGLLIGPSGLSAAFVSELLHPAAARRMLHGLALRRMRGRWAAPILVAPLGFFSFVLILFSASPVHCLL